MLWFLFAFLTAFFQSIRDLFNKTKLREFDEYIVTFSMTFFTAVGLSLLLFFLEIPPLGSNFFPALFASGTLNALSLTMYVRAIKYYDLSLVTPITAFTPLFLLVTSPLIVGEFPQTMGLIGVVLIVGGSYILNLKEKERGYFAPWRSLFTNPGSRLALLVAFLWSITSNLDKVGVQNSAPIFWAICVYFWISIVLLPVVLLKSRKNLPPLNRRWFKLIFYGFLNSMMIGCQMTAINLTLVAYVVSVKRTSALFSVIFGSLILKEERIKEKLVGSIIMVIGVFFIALA
jgi:uncharacterized membrane protein